MAIDGATCLRRDANRLAALFRHEDGLDLRGFFIFPADREQISNGPIDGWKSAYDARKRDARFFREAHADSAWHIRHRGEIKSPLDVKRAIYLRAAVGGLAERCEKRPQFLRRFSEQFHRHARSPLSYPPILTCEHPHNGCRARDLHVPLLVKISSKALGQIRAQASKGLK